MKDKIFSLLNIKRLIVFEAFVSAVTVILLSAVLILAWMSSEKVTEVVTSDFNQQQLVLARHAASQIENDLQMLKRELSLLSSSPSIQYFEEIWLSKRMLISYSSIKGEGALEMRYVESNKPRTYMVDSRGYRIIDSYPEDLDYLKWGGESINKGTIMVTDVLPVIEGKYHKMIMKMVMPVWQVSADEIHPAATNKFSGVLLFVVDATALIESETNSIRSGKTGYTWVIDGKGIFLNHYEKEFIGKSAFEARREKQPTISFDQINAIQKEMMLTGKEGTSWYISGWHRGREGRIKKLIAYTPVHVTGDEKQSWSVAVAAPTTEVENSIRSIHTRQLLMQAVIVVFIVVGGFIIHVLMTSWSSTLTQEVELKTRAFKKSEQRYKSLVENAEDIIFTVDCDGCFLSINNNGAKFFNKTPEDIIGRNMSEIFLWPGGEAMLTAVKEVVESKQGEQITHPVKIAEQEYWLNTNFRRLLDEDGNIYAVLGISRNITDRKKIEESSYHTEKLASMGTLAAGVAHEINNPLGIILGFSDLLLEKAKPDSEEADILKTIAKHGLRAKRVVENLLSFARYTECKEELVDINKGIENVIAVVGNTLLMKKITLKQNLNADLPRIKGCSEELQQVFFNIINNAASAMNGGGTLSIETRSLNNNELVEIRFADTGHGIRKEHRSKIFDPLFTTKKVGEGTGLGLSVSYGILTKHGGTIYFESKTKDESEDSGTTFIITLPAIKQ